MVKRCECLIKLFEEDQKSRGPQSKKGFRFLAFCEQVQQLWDWGSANFSSGASLARTAMVEELLCGGGEEEDRRPTVMIS